MVPATEPAASAESRTEAVVRPAPHRWIRYALGGRLPERNRAWVLHDTTTGTWWLRHLARMLVQLAIPIALVLVLLPAPWALRAACAGGGVLLALIFSLAYISEVTENRVIKAGYPAGTAVAARERTARLRTQRDNERRSGAAARRAARYRERLGRDPID